MHIHGTDPTSMSLNGAATSIDAVIERRSKRVATPEQTIYAASINAHTQRTDVYSGDTRNSASGGGGGKRQRLSMFCNNPYCKQENDHLTHNTERCNRTPKGDVIDHEREVIIQRARVNRRARENKKSMLIGLAQYK